MHKFKTISFCVVILILIIILGTAYASASEIMPRADPEFDSAFPNLLSSKIVRFYASTYQNKQILSVTECWLEQKVRNTWVDLGDLELPSEIYYDTFVYAGSMDYSSVIGSGTYRIWATFDADGHEITRDSNERTFDY